LFPLLGLNSQAATDVRSPDGHLVLSYELQAGEVPSYRMLLDGREILGSSKLGLLRDDDDFTKGLRVLREEPVVEVADDYSLPGSKRLLNHYRARRLVVHLASSKGKPMDLEFQVSNDGAAFRYHFPDSSPDLREILAEQTSFALPQGSLAWLQPIAVAKQGWCVASPSYEEHYQMGIPVGTPSTLGVGWVFPALFRNGDTWLAVSETDLGPDWCGSRLAHLSPNGEYSVALADPRETIGTETARPHSRLPWTSPWRLVAAGSLATVTESTLGTDLASAPTVATTPPQGTAVMGKSSWSWPLLGDAKTTYEVQKQFIDYAAEMGWRYCLIDALWDTQIGYERTAELAAYAKKKGVDLLLWYNSNGSWNEAPQTPKDRMHTHEARIAEFERLKAMGIRGLKIDFFGGDGQPMIRLYHDILRDAAPYGFMMNFHGATLPRGWERTYPHLATMEAIKGFEYVTFEQVNADAQPSHAAMLPFTRNLFDPMDFTPVCLDRLPKGERRTTVAFELAQAVLYTSGIQHYAEIPEVLAKQPAFVRTLLREIPASWQDSKLLAGFPGRDVVMARKAADGRWYVAGINGESKNKTLSFSLERLQSAGSGRLILDGEKGITEKAFRPDASGPVKVEVPANGGFILVLDALVDG